MTLQSTIADITSKVPILVFSSDLCVIGIRLPDRITLLNNFALMLKAFLRRCSWYSFTRSMISRFRAASETRLSHSDIPSVTESSASFSSFEEMSESSAASQHPREL